MQSKYIQPESVVVEIITEQLLAGSMTISNKGVDVQLTPRKDIWGNEGMWRK